MSALIFHVWVWASLVGIGVTALAAAAWSVKRLRIEYRKSKIENHFKATRQASTRAENRKIQLEMRRRAMAVPLLKKI